MFKNLLRLSLLLIVISSVIFIKHVSATNAYFSDGKVLSNNTFSTGHWGVTPIPSPTPKPCCSICIHKFMWMGSIFSDLDKWIELKNMTGLPIDIGKWTLENIKDSDIRTIHFPTDFNTVIPADGFLLISKDTVKDLPLLDLGNGSLVLKDDSGNIIDQTTADIWPAESSTGTPSGERRTIERNRDPGDGTHNTDWHFCTGDDCSEGK